MNNDEFEDLPEELEIVDVLGDSDRALDADGNPMVSHSDEEERQYFYLGGYLNGAYDHIFEGRTICDQWKNDKVFGQFYELHNNLDEEAKRIIGRFQADPAYAAEWIEKIAKRRGE